jgi:chorismate mutase / prephenate dehydratase
MWLRDHHRDVAHRNTQRRAARARQVLQLELRTARGLPFVRPRARQPVQLAQHLWQDDQGDVRVVGAVFPEVRQVQEHVGVEDHQTGHGRASAVFVRGGASNRGLLKLCVPALHRRARVARAAGGRLHSAPDFREKNACRFSAFISTDTGAARPCPNGTGSSAAPLESLQQCRQQIDQLDAEIVRLLQQRAALAQQIGALKDASARGVYAPERERDVLEHAATAGAGGPLLASQLQSIFREIISACRALERALHIGYFGPRATWTHQAALQQFGESAEYVAVDTIPEVFAETQRGVVDFGVVPVENSTEGPVPVTLDTFLESDLKVCSEIVLPISMQLMSNSPRDEIHTLYSNAVAYAQCRQWVTRNLPGVRVVEVVSTAKAAMMAAEESGTAALGPPLAAHEYGVEILQGDVQDLASNFTRFYVIARQAIGGPTGRDKTAAIISIRDHPGALHDLAGAFARQQVNMTSIHSRPSRLRAWDYVFFIELDGHERDPQVAEAIAEISSQSVFVKVLGSWPKID